MIEFAAEGCTREDFVQHLQSISPQSKKSTLNTQLNALIAEWGVLKALGNYLQLTPRGEAFLEMGEPDEVIDWMITRILGFDYLLDALRNTALSNRDAILVCCFRNILPFHLRVHHIACSPDLAQNLLSLCVPNVPGRLRVS